MNQINQNRHIGKFDISLNNIENNSDIVKLLMSNVIIIRAECIYAEDLISYTAISEKYFDRIQPGSEIPKYQFVINNDKLIANKLN